MLTVRAAAGAARAARGCRSRLSSQLTPCLLEPRSRARVLQALFAKYDVNNNKKIEKGELERMLLDLNLKRLECSEKLIHQFVSGEFDKVGAACL